MFEVRRLAIVLLKAAPMFGFPRIVWREANVPDRHVMRMNALGDDGDGQPLETICRLDLIAISPAMLIVLDTIVENKDVGLLNLMKVTAPRDVARLQNHTV